MNLKESGEGKGLCEGSEGGMGRGKCYDCITISKKFKKKETTEAGDKVHI